MPKCQDWRKICPAAASFSSNIASTWAATPSEIPREIKNAMRAAQVALCELDDLIEAHVREEEGDDESDLQEAAK